MRQVINASAFSGPFQTTFTAWTKAKILQSVPNTDIHAEPMYEMFTMLGNPLLNWRKLTDPGNRHGLEIEGSQES